MTRMIDLTSPAPPAWMPLLWGWIQECPDANLDDYGPKSLEAFCQEMQRRAAIERTWAVSLYDRPAGVIAYLPCREYVGMFHGICFAQNVCGTGLAHEAVERVLAQLWREGVEKVSAAFFADNERVFRFLVKLGAEYEGVLKAQTRRGGQPVDTVLMALFNPAVTKMGKRA